MNFIVYESPKRLSKTLLIIHEVFGNVELCVARELTKIHEEYIRGRVREVMEKVVSRQNLKGELVIVFRSE
jgi:16S rRNA (cytidine1402-2'-O)-methyltransferase